MIIIIKTTNPFLPIKESNIISEKYKTIYNYLGASLIVEEGLADSAFNILNFSDHINAPLLEPPQDGDTSGGINSYNRVRPPPSFLPLPLPANTAPSSIFNTQTELTGGAPKDIGHGPSGEVNARKEKVDMG